jgi:hypothetical protein
LADFRHRSPPIGDTPLPHSTGDKNRQENISMLFPMTARARHLAWLDAAHYGPKLAQHLNRTCHLLGGNAISGGAASRSFPHYHFDEG